MRVRIHAIDSAKDSGSPYELGIGNGKNRTIETDEIGVHNNGDSLLVTAKFEESYGQKTIIRRLFMNLYPRDLVKIVNTTLGRRAMVRTPTKNLTEAKKLMRKALKLIEEDSPKPKTHQQSATNGR